jgi:hypothetical protein
MGSEERRTAHRPTERGAVPDPVILELRYRPPERGSDQRTENGDSSDLARADLARQLNAEIYKAGRFSTQPEDEESELTFFCACGCMAEVKRSLRDYVTRGAIVAGHARPADRR